MDRQQPPTNPWEQQGPQSDGTWPGHDQPQQSGSWQGQGQPQQGGWQGQGGQPQQGGSWPNQGQPQQPGAWPQQGQPQQPGAWPQQGQPQQPGAWPQQGQPQQGGTYGPAQGQQGGAWPGQQGQQQWPNHGQPQQPGAWPAQGQPQPGGQWPPQQSVQDAGAPEALKPKKTKWLRILAVPILLVLAYGVTWFVNRDQVESAEVGNCMKLDESDSKSPFSVVDCNDPDAKYTVLKVIDADSKEECKDIAGASQSSSTKDNDTVCMGDKGVDPATAINVAKEGDCVAANGNDAKRVDCASPDATDKILKRLTNVADFQVEKACEPVEGATSYYTWKWESTGGTVNIPKLSADVVLCLGPK